jgi:hypothetical protein
MSWAQYASEIVLPVLLPALVCGGAGALVRLALGPRGGWLAAGISVALYAVSYTAFNHQRPEARAVTGVVRSARHRLRSRWT